MLMIVPAGEEGRSGAPKDEEATQDWQAYPKVGKHCAGMKTCTFYTYTQHTYTHINKPHTHIHT